MEASWKRHGSVLDASWKGRGSVVEVLLKCPGSVVEVLERDCPHPASPCHGFSAAGMRECVRSHAHMDAGDVHPCKGSLPRTNGDRRHCPSEGRSGHRCLCYPTPATDVRTDGMRRCGSLPLPLYAVHPCAMWVREACALVATPMDLTHAPCEPYPRTRARRSDRCAWR